MFTFSDVFADRNKATPNSFDERKETLSKQIKQCLSDIGVARMVLDKLSFYCTGQHAKLSMFDVQVQCIKRVSKGCAESLSKIILFKTNEEVLRDIIAENHFQRTFPIH